MPKEPFLFISFFRCCHFLRYFSPIGELLKKEKKRERKRERDRERKRDRERERANLFVEITVFCQGYVITHSGYQKESSKNVT